MRGFESIIGDDWSTQDRAIGYWMIGPDVPLANIEAMCEAFWKYGSYRIGEP